MRGSGDIEHIDATLASLARQEGALRLRLGQLLEMLGRGAVFDLGFSSLGAYALERCERSARWVEAARCIARRVEVLPQLRRAMALGEVSWSMGDVLARVATPSDERSWLEMAESHTVRQVRVRVDEAIRAAHAADPMRANAHTTHLEATEGAVTARRAVASACRDGLHRDGLHRDGADGERRRVQPCACDDALDDLCTLTCTVNREDAWLFEATRCLLEQLGERGAAAQIEALLAEAHGTLLALLPRRRREHSAVDVGLRSTDVARQRWLERLRRWREEAELACEQRIVGQPTRNPSASPSPMLGSLVAAAALGIEPLEHLTAVQLDRQVRSLAAALARHELELSQLVLGFHRAGGWRRLGYATEAQYARERLGLSRSSLAARRALALRLESLPSVAAALGKNQIGVEAALQIVRIATANTEAAWIERASRRTIKHLREEVAAAQVAVRLAGESDCPPPDDDEIATFHTLERSVVSGRFGQPQADVARPSTAGSAPSVGAGREPAEPSSEPRRAWRIMLGSLTAWLASGLQMSAAAPRPAPSRGAALAGRVTLRLRMTRETQAMWRSLEAQARCCLREGTSWLRFACLSVWHSWRHLLGTELAYGHIYVRDRFRCTSPVCNRRDVTPHHIHFRSAGGGDEDQNLTSPCTWCHLHGVHGGRIRAIGTADHLRWELGPKSAPILIIDGRERQTGFNDCRTAWPA
jgi:hypothetical protein